MLLLLFMRLVHATHACSFTETNQRIVASSHASYAILMLELYAQCNSQGCDLTIRTHCELLEPDISGMLFVCCKVLKKLHSTNCRTVWYLSATRMNVSLFQNTLETARAPCASV
uniref:Putative secreted protein n=1 Tax=Amblyomma parvum TaxID=251391 RepID=A0A023G0E2_AMBPA